MLVQEAALLYELNKCNMRGIPTINHLGMTKKYTYVSMRSLGPSISELLNFCGGRFTVKTTLMIGMQLLDRLQSLHNAHIIH